MMTFTEIADEAVSVYLDLRSAQRCEPDVARMLMHDHIKEMAQHHVIIEEPECCDAEPSINWLHHSECPEVQAHHAQHDTRHAGCPTCNIQRRLPKAAGGTLDNS